MTELRILNESARPTDELEELCRFVIGRAVHVPPLAVRALKPNRQDYPSGTAHLDNWTEWSLRLYPRRSKLRAEMFALAVRTVTDESHVLGIPRICWHATEAGKVASAEGAPAWYARVAEAYERGETKMGRWPIYVVRDWQEAFVHTFAHELSHVLQYRMSGKVGSEVRCETFALRCLDAFARVCVP